MEKTTKKLNINNHKLKLKIDEIESIHWDGLIFVRVEFYILHGNKRFDFIMQFTFNISLGELENIEVKSPFNVFHNNSEDAEKITTLIQCNKNEVLRLIKDDINYFIDSELLEYDYLASFRLFMLTI